MPVAPGVHRGAVGEVGVFHLGHVAEDVDGVVVGGHRAVPDRLSDLHGGIERGAPTGAGRAGQYLAVRPVVCVADAVV